LIAGITQDQVLGMQVIEGGTDAVIFENFIYHCLKKLRTDPLTRHKHVVVLMDNATIHKHSSVKETIVQLKATLLLNA
jgi:hypothetical protein